MLEADQLHDDKIVENVETMQTSADAAVFAFLLRLLDLFPPSLTLTQPPPLILPRSLALARALSLPFPLSLALTLARAHALALALGIPGTGHDEQCIRQMALS